VKYPNDNNGYSRYLDEITEITKEENLVNHIINSELYKSNLKIFDQYELKYQLGVLIENSHNPHRVLKPLWDIVYKQHPKYAIDEMMNILTC
jgi:hypothetical protein